MEGENGRRLNTNANVANVADDRGEKLTPPFSAVNSDRSSISSKTKGESSQEGNRSGSAKISDASLNVPSPHAINLKPSERAEASCRLEKSTTDSPQLIKRCSDVARDSFVLTESPIIQVMERPKTSNPRRAALSSNSGRTESPNRWSVDSNDSLFSIRMGNDSFSKDHSLWMSGEMHGIGELSLSEAYLPRVSHKSGELEPYNSPAAKAIDEALEDVKQDVNPAVEEPNRDPPEASISTHTDSNLSRSSDPHASNDDIKSDNESFAALSKSVSTCPNCRFLCCNKMDCCLRWPSYSSCCRWPSCSSCCSWFGWPSCSNYSCLSCPCSPCCCSCCSKCYGSCCCYSWRRESKRVRSVSSYALMDRGLASSSKHNL